MNKRDLLKEFKERLKMTVTFHASAVPTLLKNNTVKPGPIYLPSNPA